MSRGTILVLFTVLTLGGCAAAPTPIPIPTSTPASTPAYPTPIPAYPGRLLALSGAGRGSTGPVTLFQLTAASGAPVEVGSTQPLSGEVISWSADGAHIVSGDGTLAAVGTAAVDHLPNADKSYVDSASFSPDGKRLAYTAQRESEVVVYDLAAKTGQAQSVGSTF